MVEPRWISLEAAQILHEMQIDEFGGSHGIRDVGLLDSALARPLNLFAYEDGVTLARLAASYCFGISRNHSFIDGNKRVAYVVARTILIKNGFDVVSTYDDKLSAMRSVASGTMTETELADWYAERVAPIE